MIPCFDEDDFVADLFTEAFLTGMELDLLDEDAVVDLFDGVRPLYCGILFHQSFDPHFQNFNLMECLLGTGQIDRLFMTG